MQYKYQVLDKEEAYRGFLRVTKYIVNFEYFTGEMSGPIIRESSGKGVVVAALAYDRRKDVFVFVEQFRIGMMVAGASPWNLEIVAGIMDKVNETPIETITREIEEEIGTEADKISLMCEYFSSPGSSGGRTMIYFAEVDSDNVKPHTGIHEEGEDIAVQIVSRVAAMENLKDGKINNAMMLIALQHFSLNQNKFR